MVFRFLIEGRVEGVGGWFCNPQLLNQGRILKLEKIWFFCVKWWFFTRNTPKIFAPPSARPNFLMCAPSNLKSWIRPWWPLSSTGTSMFWNRRLVLLDYCSWCSRRTTKLLTMSCKKYISLSFSCNENFKCCSSCIRLIDYKMCLLRNQFFPYRLFFFVWHAKIVQI